jgi:hypothetical protein
MQKGISLQKNFSQMQQGAIKSRYKFTKNLGSGSFGTVYKCQDKFSGDLKAIKAIKKANLGS